MRAKTTLIVLERSWRVIDDPPEKLEELVLMEMPRSSVRGMGGELPRVGLISLVMVERVIFNRIVKTRSRLWLGGWFVDYEQSQDAR